MAQILQPSRTSTSPPPQTPQEDDSRSSSPLKLSLDPIPRNQVLAHRLSSYSQSRSRQTSAVFPLFHSSLSYALVRDFAYPPYNPMHYGPMNDMHHSTLSTPDGDYDSTRRVSDPPPWDTSAGPWRDSSFDNAGTQLPSTAFGLGGGAGAGGDSDDDERSSRRQSRRISKHRKSKSYADMEGYTRGRRRSSRDRKSMHRGGGGNPQAGNSATNNSTGGSSSAYPAQHYVGYFAHEGSGVFIGGNNNGNNDDNNRNDSAYSRAHPPFREDSDSVPYSPSALEEHRPESASLDESFAGPSLALYDFHPENDNELALREGQVIQVGYRHGQGWLVAMNVETGEQGLVPEEYVRLIRDIEGGWPADGGQGGAERHDEEDEEEETEELTIGSEKGKGGGGGEVDERSGKEERDIK